MGNDRGDGRIERQKRFEDGHDAIALESGQLVLHKKASELLADPNIKQLFLGGGHVPDVVSAASASMPS